MERFASGYTLEICPGGFPFSTDSMLLADFVRLPKHARVMDLGSGCGTLGILLCGRYPDCRVQGIELTENAHKAALGNIEANGLDARLSSICADLRTVAPDNCHACVSNPPYFSGGPASRQTPLARRTDAASLPELFAAAGRVLRWGGDFFLVHKPEMLAQLCACAAAEKLEPKRLCLVRHRKNGPIILLLMQCRKGGKPGLTMEEMYLFEEDGTPSPDYRRIYNI